MAGKQQKAAPTLRRAPEKSVRISTKLCRLCATRRPCRARNGLPVAGPESGNCCSQVLHWRIVRTFPFLAAGLAWLAVEAAAAGLVVGGQVVAGQWFAPYGSVPPPSIIYDAFGRCLAPLNCPDYEQMRRFLERYERNHGARFAPDLPGSAPPVVPRDVPATAEAEIQPAYRHASQVRPEFAPPPVAVPAARGSAGGRRQTGGR